MSLKLNNLEHQLRELEKEIKEAAGNGAYKENLLVRRELLKGRIRHQKEFEQ